MLTSEPTKSKTGIFDIDKPYFIIVYFLTLCADLFVKLNLEQFPYRYLSKSLLMVLLIVFYIKNQSQPIKSNRIYTLLALIMFLIASVLVINHENNIRFIIAMLFFVMGKLLYCMRFSNNRDFSLLRLLPFMVFGFVLMVLLFSLIYNQLGYFLLPVLLYFFISLLLFLFAYLRKNDIDTKSYYYVFSAMVLLLISEIIMAIKTYYITIPYQDIFSMLFYGIAQFLIIYGILIEVKMVEDE